MAFADSVVVPKREAYAANVFMLVILAARGVALIAWRLADRRGRKPPPDDRDDELILAA